MTDRCTTLRRHLGSGVLALFILAALLASPDVARAQGCTAINNLLIQGVAAPEIAQALGVTVNDVEGCRQILQQQPAAVGPAGRPPLGAAGPPPLGAAGSPPYGAAGAPPLGAPGPPAMNKGKRLP
jgi:hypothetical protein